MKLLKSIIPAIAFIAIAHLGYCDANMVTAQVDGEIPQETRDAIRMINNKLFESMKDNKPNVMINMFAEEGRNDPNLAENVTTTYKQLGDLAKGTAFDILHEYYIDVQGKSVSTVTVPGDGDNKFIMGVNAGKGPLFISLLTTSGNFKDMILCFVYLKTKDGWQLYIFHSGIYKIGGKGPVQWYEQAKAMYDKGWDVPAMLWMQFVQSFVRPAPFIQYEIENEMQELFKEGAIATSKKYRFPFKATWVKDMPMVYGLDTQFNKNNLEPVIIYVTKHPLNREVAIQEEVDAITSKIEKVIPGITKCSFEVGYRAFSEPPLDEKKEHKYRSIFSKL